MTTTTHDYSKNETLALRMLPFQLICKIIITFITVLLWRLVWLADFKSFDAVLLLLIGDSHHFSSVFLCMLWNPWIMSSYYKMQFTFMLFILDCKETFTWETAALGISYPKSFLVLLQRLWRKWVEFSLALDKAVTPRC